jgi:alcohol dehydrogenase
MKKTRAVVLTAPGKIEMQEFNLPEVGDEDGIVKMELIGVCGSDPSIYSGKSRGSERPYPIILGHEIVGRVDKMGVSARKRHGVEEGDRVVVEYAFGCGTCKACLAGRYTVCKNFYTYGSGVSCKEPPHLFGAYADYLYVHPRAMVHKINDSIPPEVGVLICAVIGNSVRWLRQIGGVSIGQSVVIIGPGQQGLSATAVAKESGAEPIFVLGLSRDKERLEMARRFGADVIIDVEKEAPERIISKATAGEMASLVMDVTGHPSGASTAISVAGTGASIVLPGIYGSNTEVPLLLDNVVRKEMRLLGVYSQDFKAVEPAIKLAARNKYPFADLITHRFPLEAAEHAIKIVAGEIEGESPLKVVLDPRL